MACVESESDLFFTTSVVPYVTKLYIHKIVNDVTLLGSKSGKAYFSFSLISYFLSDLQLQRCLSQWEITVPKIDSNRLEPLC